MPDRSGFHPTPSLYAALMLVAGLAAVVAAWLVAGALGGEGRPAMLAASCTALGAIAALAPALFGPRPRVGFWGIAVVASSAARLILMLAAGLVLVPEGGARPFWLGIVTGAGVILIAETAIAAWFLTHLDRATARRAAPAPEHA